jgi:dienelactone hydrolase
MRTFEILLVACLLAVLVALMVPERKRATVIAFLPAFAGLLTVVHLAFEGYRWHMLPMYVVVVVLLATTAPYVARQLKGAPPNEPSKALRVAGIVACVLGLISLGFGMTAAAILFPVAPLPAPTGPFTVGTTYMEFADSTRPETLTEDPNDLRSFTGRVWYPAETSAGFRRVPYSSGTPTIGSITEQGGEFPAPPDILFNHLELVPSHSMLDAPWATAEAAYPVVFFSPGFLSSFEGCQVYAEDLASHGYVVISVDQPYESRSVVNDDGSATPFSQEHMAAYLEHLEAILPAWERFWTQADVVQRREIAREILESEHFMDNVLRIRVADIQYVVDWLQQGGALGPGDVADRIDLSRLGVFGHSMGGAVVGQTLLVDARFTAGINLDGFQWGDVVSGRVAQPIMVMYSDFFSGANEFLTEQYGPDIRAMTVRGSTHMDFCDDAYMMPITKRMGMAGPIPGDRMVKIGRTYIRSFFDKHLKGEDDSFTDGPSTAFPEVEFADYLR